MGDAGEWDALTILPSIPVVLDREIRLYYGGGSEQSGRDGVVRWRALPGLATLRRDGFTSIRLDDKQRDGSLVTIPFELPHRGALSRRSTSGTLAAGNEQRGNAHQAKEPVRVHLG